MKFVYFLTLRIVKFNGYLYHLFYLEDVKTNKKDHPKNKLFVQRRKNTGRKITNFVNNISALRMTGSHVLPAIKIQKDETVSKQGEIFF